MNTKNDTSYDLWLQQEAERVLPLLDGMDFDTRHEVRKLLIDAFYAGVSHGIDEAFAEVRKGKA